MYPRTFKLHVGNLRPVMATHVFVAESSIPYNGTGLLTAKFYLLNLDTDVLKITAAAATITTPNPLVLTYTWAGTDTDTVGRFAAWFVGYWGAADTIPETFEGPEVRVFAAGTRLVY